MSTTLLNGLGELERGLEQSGPQWLRELRLDGRRRFETLGWPTTRDEEWRNTNVAEIGKQRFAGPAPSNGGFELEGLAGLDLGGPRLVLADGRLIEARDCPKDPDGVWVGSLTEALEQLPERIRPLLEGSTEQGPFEALNRAFVDVGAVVLIAPGQSLEATIQVIHVAGLEGTPTANQPRTLIDVGNGSRVRIVETFCGAPGSAASYLTNSVSHSQVGDAAALDHYRLQLESASAFHVSTAWRRQGRDSRSRSWQIDLGGRLVRHNVRGLLDGEGGDAQLYGLYVTRDSQHVDSHTVLDHAKPHCDSREVYKGILDDRSRSVFSGRIVVRPGAQKTDAKQSNPNLLLSRTALAHTQPQLEIYADDVKCTHGATVGQLDEQALFYLRSRGVAAPEARRMLIHAFAGEVVDSVDLEPLRDALRTAVSARLEGREV